MPEFGERLAFNMFQATYPGFTTDNRDVELVDSCGVAVDDGHKTEGLFAAAVYDLVDSANENDPVIPGSSFDQLSFNIALPYQIYDQVAPTTPTAFFNEVSSRQPGQKKAIWSTAMNGGVNLDTQNPSAVTGLTSGSHVPNVPSSDGTISINWTEAADDWSGAWLHSVSWTASPAIPDTNFEVSAVTSTVSPQLPVGTYYANVRVRDRHGRWGTTFASAGPFIVKAPDPGDFHFLVDTGWAKPVVPRNLGNSTTLNVPVPTALDGNAATTRWNAVVHNDGETTAFSSRVQIEVDGDSVAARTTNDLAPDDYWYELNRDLLTVRGGRHTFGGFVDSEEGFAEANEANNTWARQWGWTGLPMLPNSLISRAAAPYRIAGHSDIAGGETIYQNSDGMRFSSSGWWNAVWAYATDSDDDTDVRLHFPSTVPDTAFTKTIASSVRLGGFLDAVIVNRNTLGILNWDVGVVNYSGGASAYHARHVTSNAFTFGDSIDVVFAADDFITLHDMFVGAPNFGDVVVTLRTTPGVTAHVEWLDRTFGYGGLTAAVETATTDENGLARFIVNVTSSGYYGVVCYRDPKDGTGAQPFTLQVERAPADLAVLSLPGWHSPVVPRPTTDGTFVSVPMPDTLHGNTLPTYFNMAAKNIGTIQAPATTSWMMVDGALAATYGYPLWNAGAQMLFNSTYAVYIRGGRHTLSHILDGPDLVEELVNGNNQYGEQYVWSPLPLAADTPLSRVAPPDRTAGWSEVSIAEPLYFNSDGLRTVAAPPVLGLHQWSAVAVMPAATSDVDLRIHERSPGTKNGFRNPLATSVWTEGMSDYVLANFNLTPYRQFDVGAVRWSGTDPYTVQATTSQRRTIAPDGGLGTFAQAANDMLDLHEVWLTPGSWSLILETISGDANLALSLHGPTAVQGKSNALSSAWFEPSGLDEQVTFDVANAGYFCLAVWKTAHADLAKPVTYRLGAYTGIVDAGGDAPDAVAFSLPWPNPAGGTTRVTFALPAAGAVDIDVFDVGGARVRTLLRGEQPAGRHSVQWDGRTNDGRRAPAGLYYLRFSGGGTVATRKLVLVGM